MPRARVCRPYELGSTGPRQPLGGRARYFQSQLKFNLPSADNMIHRS